MKKRRATRENLPRPASSFVGRRLELERIVLDNVDAASLADGSVLLASRGWDDGAALELVRIAPDGTVLHRVTFAASPGAVSLAAPPGSERFALLHHRVDGAARLVVLDAALRVLAETTVPGSAALGPYGLLDVAAATDDTWAVLVAERPPNSYDFPVVPVALRRFRVCD